jgi:hypothetical protein
VGSNIKVGPNDPCPCLALKKYKHCCKGKVDWEQIHRKNSPEWKQHISVRGRNKLFVQKVFAALQLDKEPVSNLEAFKAAFTPAAVREINEAIVDVWPQDTAIDTVLQSSKVDVSGLYVGEYEPHLLVRGVTRHCLYANKILLVDPFVYPHSLRDEFNPILNPQKYRSQTLRNFAIWLPFIPWIEAGFVEFIRTPADFDRQMNWDSIKHQREKFKNNEELRKILEESASQKTAEFAEEEGERFLILMAPDEYLRKTFQKAIPNAKPGDEDTFIEYVHKRRKTDPYYLEPLKENGKSLGEMFIHTSGASYDIAKLTASLTDSYLVTDLPSRWKEIEVDRQEHNVAMGEWSSLAKAFHGVNLQFLDNLNIEHALSVRKEGRLEPLRAFLYRVWKSACSDTFKAENVRHFADELEAKVAEAAEEWKNIDRDLMKWTGAQTAGGLMAAPAIASGNAEFFAAAIAIAGATTLGATYLRRRGFIDKYPAGFFMKLKNKK